MEPSEYETIARLEETHWWYAGMRNVARRVLRTLPLPSGARILDAGCGAGGGLKWLTEFGAPAGLDLHPLATRYAARVSKRVARASVQHIPCPDSTFDLVTSFEVLYHLAVTDDVAALREFARVLKPDGWLMVRLPAHDWLRGAHDRQVHTRHRYSALELRAKIYAAGLTLTRLTSVGMFLFPPAVARRVFQRADDAHTDVTLPAPRLNRLLTALLSAEGVWLSRFDLPVGSSLLVVARK